MKRYGNLFEKICDIDNLLLAHQNARLGKSSYKEVQMVDKNPRYYAEKLRDLLLSKKFTTSKYQVFWKDCGTKQRYIYKLPYWPDRIVQHALMQIVEPIFTRTLIRDTFQSIKGRGTHDCRKRLQKAIENIKEDSYVLNFDIKQFYPSVDNQLLKVLVRHKIKCKDTLWLLDDIINSTKGLPVGNYSSQILGNLYLSVIDHYAKETLRIKHYFRYCDDIVIIADTKEQCNLFKKKLFSIVDRLKLTVKSNWQVFPFSTRAVDFIGWVFSKSRVRLRKRTARRFTNKVMMIKKNHRRILPTHAVCSIMSYWGQFKHINSKRLWKQHIDKEFMNKTDKFFDKQNLFREVICK